MIDFSQVKTVTIPEGIVTKIATEGKTLWEAIKFTNQVPISIDTNGSIYNNGKGYKDGYRVRSGGLEAAQSFTSITGYIPYKKGDKLYIYPPFTGENTSNTVNFFDGSFNNLGQVCDAGVYYGFCNSTFKTKVVDGVSVLDISAVTVSGVNNIAYVRIGNTINDGSSTGLKSPIYSGSEMIVTVNEEIT